MPDSQILIQIKETCFIILAFWANIGKAFLAKDLNKVNELL
jgi:hypothetical protein